MKALLAGKLTGTIKGFTSKAGKPFSARLRLEDPATGRVAFVFEAAKKTTRKGA